MDWIKSWFWTPAAPAAIVTSSAMASTTKNADRDDSVLPLPRSPVRFRPLVPNDEHDTHVYTDSDDDGTDGDEEPRELQLDNPDQILPLSEVVGAAGKALIHQFKQTPNNPSTVFVFHAKMATIPPQVRPGLWKYVQCKDGTLRMLCNLWKKNEKRGTTKRWTILVTLGVARHFVLEQLHLGRVTARMVLATLGSIPK